VDWRRARDVGALAGLTKSRGRPARDRAQERITELEAEKRRLEQDLAKARFVVDVQSKLHAYAGDRGLSSLLFESVQ